MDVTEAIKSRRSIRGFKPEPVPQTVLAEILDIARWAPSGVNKQPWEFVVLTGKVLAAVKRANEEELDKGVPAHPYMAKPILTGVYRQRQVESGKQLYKIAGIEKGDEAKRREWVKRDMRFFDAPAAILVCADQEVPEPRTTLEVGIVTQTIALAALNLGLGTCIMVAPVEYPDVVARTANIPTSKRIYCAIAIGYPDWDYPPNKLRTSRESLDALVMWRS